MTSLCCHCPPDAAEAFPMLLHHLITGRSPCDVSDHLAWAMKERGQWKSKVDWGEMSPNSSLPISYIEFGPSLINMVAGRIWTHNYSIMRSGVQNLTCSRLQHILKKYLLNHDAPAYADMQAYNLIITVNRSGRIIGLYIGFSAGWVTNDNPILLTLLPIICHCLGGSFVRWSSFPWYLNDLFQVHIVITVELSVSDLAPDDLRNSWLSLSHYTQILKSPKRKLKANIFALILYLIVFLILICHLSWCFISFVDSYSLLYSMREVFFISGWRDAMQEEMMTLEQNLMWLCFLPQRKQGVGCWWVYNV